MRSSSHSRNTRTGGSFPWNWIIVISIIIALFFLSSLFSGKSNTPRDTASLTVMPGSGSEVYIKPVNGSSKQITGEEQFYTSDSALSIANGFAHVYSVFLDGFLDKSSEMTYTEHMIDGEKIEFTRGRLWIESHGKTILQMKNLEATVKDGAIVMAEQPNQIFSTLYVLKGDVSLIAGTNTYVLTAGKKIMISKSDLANPGTTLDMLTGPIDDNLRQNPLFILRNGGSLLTAISGRPSTSSGIILSGSTLSGKILSNTVEKYIEIVSPRDQAIINSPTVDISGKMLSKDIKRVTFNDLDAIVSPVDESFSMKGVVVTGNIFNLVYKAYSKDTTLLERGVITLYPKNHQSGTDTLTPTNFPINDKQYTIYSPSENPYITTETSITVKGMVPKNIVQYIMVNNFRLKRFVPYSSSWYYYANSDTDTMKEGINLYEINFYGSNDELIYKRLFTIVKEQKRSISGETIQ